MAQILIRDLAPEVVDKLKARAQRNNRSLEGEMRIICQSAAGSPVNDMVAEAEQVRSLFQGRTFDDSARLLREDRER